MGTQKDRLKQFLNLNSIFLVICLAFFSIFLIETYKVEKAGTYLLPRLLCIFGAITIVLRLLIDFFAATRRRIESVEEKAESEGVNVVYSLIFAAIYFFIIRYLGFILATFLAILGFSYVMRYRNKKLSLILAVVIPVALYLLFASLLKVSLPRGIVESLVF